MEDAKTKVVPVEPTDEMLSSGQRYMSLALADGLDRRERQRVGYLAMLAAAPQPAASDVPHDVVRAQTIEECAKIAEDEDGELSSCGMDRNTAASQAMGLRVAAAIRALATPALSTSTEEALRAENAKWGRADLAKGLAALDGISLRDVLTSSGDAANMTNWREYLGRADDLLAHLSLAAIIKERVNGPRVSVNIDDL